MDLVLVAWEVRHERSPEPVCVIWTRVQRTHIGTRCEQEVRRQICVVKCGMTFSGCWKGTHPGVIDPGSANVRGDVTRGSRVLEVACWTVTISVFTRTYHRMHTHTHISNNAQHDGQSGTQRSMLRSNTQHTGY